MKKLNFGSFLKLSAIIAAFLVVLLPATFDFSNQGDNVVQINTAQATHGIYTYTGPYNLGTCPPPPDDPEQPCASLSAWAFNGIAEFTISAEISWFADSDGDGVYDGFPDEFINHCPIITYTGSGGASGWSGELGCDDFQVRPVSGSGDGGTSVLIAAGDLNTERPYHDPGYITWTVPYSGEPNQICYGISYSSGSFPFSGSVTPCLVNTNPLGAASFSITSNDPTKSWTVNGEYDTNSGTGSTGSTIVAVDSNGSSHTLVPSGSPLSITCTLNGVSGCGSSVTLFDGDHVDWNIVYQLDGFINVFVNGLPSGTSGSWTITSVDESYSNSGPNGGPYTTRTVPNTSGEIYTVTASPAGGCSPPAPIDVTLNSGNNYTGSVILDYKCGGGVVEICNNGIDDDGDGLVDGADPDCGGSSNYSLQVTVTGTGTGTVSSQPGGINCPGDCIQSYTAGSIVTLIPQVLSGTFVGWSGACTGTGNCTLVMDSNKSVTATFNSSSTPPSAPTNLTATPGCSGANPRIVLEWDPSTGDVAYYRIVRTNPDSSSSQYVTSGPVTTFTDTTLVVGEQYRYVVAAISSSGGQSSASNFAFATAPNCSLPPGTPGNAPGVSVVCVGVPPASPQINVSWSEVAGATGYRVYRSDNFSVPLKDVGSATNYTDTGADRPLNYGSSYSYRYVAYNSNGASGQSPSSPSRTATCDATINVSANTSGGSWTISPQNLNGSGLSSSHTVRPSSSGSNYVLNVNPPTGYSVQVSNSDGGSSSVNIRPGQTKSFTITFTNNTPPTPSGAPNAQVSCVPNNPPASPRVTISWNSVSGATGYRLYRNPPFSGGPSIDKSNSLSHTDTDLTYGTTYTYRYTAYNAGGESGQSPASSAVVAICNATITVNVNPPVSGGSWTITPQASPTNGSGVSTAHIVRPGSGGSNFSLTNIVPPSGYTVSSVTNSFGGGNTMTIWPGDSESFTINLQQLLTPPGISASTNNQCERAFITIVDNSSNETGFELYRDYDANFGNGSPGETLLQTIPSSSFVNGQYTYQDIPNIGTVYYHVRAVRSSPPPPIFSNPATTSVNIVDCPPQLDASINVVQVTRGSQVLPPGTRLNNGDTVTFEITVTNLDDSADAFDIATDSTVTSNLTNFSGFALSQDGGNTYNLVNGTLSGTRLLIPGNGSLGDMGPQTVWKLRFNATISSSRVNSAFDRINISGIVTSSNAFSDTYDLGYMLVYLQSSDPTQFREVAP